MKRLLIIAGLVCLSVFAAAQTPTQIRSVTSLPATCRQGTGVVPTDEVALITGGVASLYYCVSPNTWALLANGAAGTNGQIVWNNSGVLAGFTATGDATITPSTGAVVVTKTNGTAFAASATTDTTNASNISTGTLSVNRLPTSGIPNVAYLNSANSYSGGGLQNMAAMDLLIPVHSSDPATCTAGQVEFNSTSAVQKFCSSTNTWTALGTSGGSVTSVGLTVNGTSSSGLFAITGSPITNAGTFNLTLTGTNGGIPYFSSSTALSASGAGTAHGVWLAEGAGNAPVTTGTGTSGQPLLSGGSSVDPAFGALNLAGGSTVVTGTLPAGNTLGSGVVTVNGQSCLLGSSCNVNVGAPNPSLAQNNGNGSAQTAASAHMVSATIECSDSSGSGSVQSCTSSPSFTPQTGDEIIYSTTTTNTGDVTVNVNSLGAKHIRKWLGSTTLAAGDLVANAPVLMVYDGTFWEITVIGNVPGGGSINSAPQFSTAYYSASGNNNVISGIAPPTTPSNLTQYFTNTNSGGAAQADAWALPGLLGRAITGTTNSDTILTTDCQPKRVEYIGSVAVAVTLPTATTLAVANCYFQLVNNLSTTNDVTITPTTWTINGASSLPLHQGEMVKIAVDPNSTTNWTADVTETALVAASPITFTRSAASLTIGCTTCATGPGLSTSGDLASFNGTGGLALQDSGISQNNVVTAASNFANADLIQAAGNNKTASDSGIPTANVVTAASNYSNGDLVQAAGNNKTTSDSGLVAANVNSNASNFSSGNLVQATGNHTTGDSGIVAANVVTSVSNFTNGYPVQAAGANKTLTTASAHSLALPLTCADTSGSGTAQVCNTIPSFIPVVGDCVLYTTTTSNSGAALTVNVNSLGAKSIAKWQTSTSLAPDDITANTEVSLCYDGTNWEVNTIGNAPAGGGGGGSPGGSNNSIQYRVNSSTFGGFGTWNNTTSRMQLPSTATVSTTDVGGPQVAYGKPQALPNLLAGHAGLVLPKSGRYCTRDGWCITGNAAGLSFNSTVYAIRTSVDNATTLTTGDFTTPVSGGWGTGSSLAITNGTSKDQAFIVTVTAGTGPSANPTLTFTFHDGTFTNIPVYVCSQTGGTGAVSNITFTGGEPTATTLPMIWNGTPSNGLTYTISCISQGT